MVTIHNLGLAKCEHDQNAETALQQQARFDFASVGCTGVTDPMVTMMNLLGHQSPQQNKAGDAAQWFGSESRYVVPEFTTDTCFALDASPLVKDVAQAKEQGLQAKPIIIGPASYLWFATEKGGVNKFDHFESLLNVYAELLTQLADEGIEWVQFDEPVLTQTLDEDWKHAILQAYFHLQRTPVKKLVASYFGKLGDNLGLMRELTIDGVHLDTISADDEALKVADWLPNYKIVSVAVVDGSQETSTDYKDTLAWLNPIHEILGDRLWLAPSCSLMHLAQQTETAQALETTQQKLNDIQQIATSLNKAAQAAA